MKNLNNKIIWYAGTTICLFIGPGFHRLDPVHVPVANHRRCATTATWCLFDDVETGCPWSVRSMPSWDGVKITGLDSGASWLSVHSYGISRAGAMCVSLVHSHGGYGTLRPLLGPDESARNFARPGPTTPGLPACTPWMPGWQPVPVQPGVELFFSLCWIYSL